MPAGTGTSGFPAAPIGTYTVPQLEQLWIQAGGDRRYAHVMALIATRESGGNPRSQNLKAPDHSIGLWQINQLAHHGKYGTDSQLMDPLTNAKGAVALFNAVKAAGSNPLRPWSTYNPAIDNKLIGQVGKGTTLLGNGILTGGQLDHDGSVIGAITSAAKDGGFQSSPLPSFPDVAAAVSAIWNTLTDPQTWLRLLMGIGGIVIGVLSFKQLAASAGSPT